ARGVTYSHGCPPGAGGRRLCRVALPAIRLRLALFPPWATIAPHECTYPDSRPAAELAGRHCTVLRRRPSPETGCAGPGPAAAATPRQGAAEGPWPLSVGPGRPGQDLADGHLPPQSAGAQSAPALPSLHAVGAQAPVRADRHGRSVEGDRQGT